ncbi:universal stress protein [Actinopolymorpha rutila]|uniref:Nucleotide-binding universal stress UspA family protein n=1 Tax=Actinopolymorpha rutila TaxID=446787 RepID=A0A852ZT86_9ACTN|nr:universal stress protein [Actinopolymorpha rutila]NYH92210.1 nucleotide-binding universal stress UspA family protein [Actinopolymorpha rutila]
MTSRPDAESSRIVVGFDGSPCSERALEWAAGEARVHHSRMEVICAWEPVTRVAPPFFVYADEEFETEAQSILEAAAARLRTDGPVDLETKAVMAHPAAALIEASRGALLVVVGSHGHGGVAGTVLGSVSQRVAMHAHCPVVIVRPEPGHSGSA